jgi:hypothetical protein
MQLVYSSLRPIDNIHEVQQPTTVAKKRKLRYYGYKAACEKYRNEIIAIQQYMPDWKPVFKY